VFGVFLIQDFILVLIIPQAAHKKTHKNRL